MAQIELKGKSIWIPGNMEDWKRAGVSIGAGLGAALVIWVLFRSPEFAVVLGASVTLGISGLSMGKRDADALAGAFSLKSPESGRALWRAFVKGFGAAFAAVLVAHVVPSTGTASWILPLVPAIVAAVTHQLGMSQARMAQEAKAKADAAKSLFPKKTVDAEVA